MQKCKDEIVPRHFVSLHFHDGTSWKKANKTRSADGCLGFKFQTPPTYLWFFAPWRMMWRKRTRQIAGNDEFWEQERRWADGMQRGLTTWPTYWLMANEGNSLLCAHTLDTLNQARPLQCTQSKPASGNRWKVKNGWVLIKFTVQPWKVWRRVAGPEVRGEKASKKSGVILRGYYFNAV